MRLGGRQEPAAEYPLVRRGAMGRGRSGSGRRELPGPRLRFVLGERWIESVAGRALWARRGAWLRACEPALERLLELVPMQRLREVYRAPLRVERQVVAACHELHAAALLAPMARGLELDAPVRGGRRADLRVRFLSGAFHVEVKTHESRWGRTRPGGARAVQALAAAARSQSAEDTPNLLVLGGVRFEAVRGFVGDQEPGTPWSAVACLDLRVVRGELRGRGLLRALPRARHPFTPALAEVLRRHWENR